MLCIIYFSMYFCSSLLTSSPLFSFRYNFYFDAIVISISLLLWNGSIGWFGGLFKQSLSLLSTRSFLHVFFIFSGKNSEKNYFNLKVFLYFRIGYLGLTKIVLLFLYFLSNFFVLFQLDDDFLDQA